MIRFCCSNRLEALVEALAATVGAGRTSLFDPLTLVVPNTLVEGYVKQGLARRLGIAANIETGFLRGFLRKVAAASAPDVAIADRDLLEGALLELFHDPGWLSGADLAPVREYLGGDTGVLDADARDRKRVQLAAELAALFDEYAFSRPEMLAAWREGALVPEAEPVAQRWQREVWLALQGPGGLFARRGVVTLPDFFARTPVEALRPPPAVHLFGISYVARLYGAIFQTLGRATDLFVYALVPDRAAPTGVEAPAAEASPLDLWARPGRDNAQLLARLAGGSVDARFVDPPAGARAGLLAALQQAALDRAPVARRKRPTPGSPRRSAGAGWIHDQSLIVVPATDPRRELETIAAEIWSRVRDDALTFADFAVIVPQASAAVYLPLAQAVFDEASGLPHTIVDLPRAAERRILDVVALLLELPLGALGRPDLLRVAMHPTVARRFPEVDPEHWLALCEALEIVRGADRASEPPSYLDRDRTSWDQGLRRLALGAFLSGPRAGEERPFLLEGAAMLPFDLPPDLEPAARALGMLARALIAFAHAARSAPAPFATHAALLRRILAETVFPEQGDEEAALGDALRILEAVEAGLPPALPVSFRVAAELVKTRLGASTRRHRAPEGVTVASFVPMRALPFRHIFVAGLDERAFPAPESVRALDLRAGSRHPGDVSPREQDEHMFLETLLAARERITLSYVARDPVTGEEKSPSSVVRALLEVLEPERAADAPSPIVRARPPLARHEDPAACVVIPGAGRERRAAALGASLRQANGGALQLPPLGELTPMLAPEARRSVISDLDWASPPVAGAVSRPRRGLTLSDLRHFLECPLQASARVLLPVGDDDALAEAEAALREHEALDEARRETLSFLHQVMADALTPGEATGADELGALYDRQARQKTLEGVLPDGLFARALRERHLALLNCWRTGVLELTGGLVHAPAPLWLGAAPEHRRDATIVPAPTVPLADGSIVTIGGRTGLVGAAANDGSRVVISLLRSTNQNNLERDLLAPFFTHLALAALDDDARPTRAIVVRPRKDGSPEAEARLLRPVTKPEARAYLGSLASELVRDVHPYFLPSEAVLHWKKNVGKPDAGGVRDSVLLLRDDNWTRFLSEHGPIPGPKDYPVPSEELASEIVARRFGMFFAVAAPGSPATNEEPS